MRLSCCLLFLWSNTSWRQMQRMHLRLELLNGYSYRIPFLITICAMIRWLWRRSSCASLSSWSPDGESAAYLCRTLTGECQLHLGDWRSYDRRCGGWLCGLSDSTTGISTFRIQEAGGFALQAESIDYVVRACLAFARVR